MSGDYKKLYRSRDNRMIAGVCGGLGEYLGIDPTLVRLLFAFGAVFGVGATIVLYIVMMIVVPEEPYGGGFDIQPAPEAPAEDAPSEE
jgi:phage shock protein PspC (stress-responsive transcriptional regulator)